jgi:hypothetical protein
MAIGHSDASGVVLSNCPPGHRCGGGIGSKVSRFLGRQAQCTGLSNNMRGNNFRMVVVCNIG